ncbi:AMP-binding protein [Streptomyces sp. MS1.HAVA.3]|uniref:AMP-binding protein n=1 Tax=Streptomyces caledonius TaxID=3134107 RepID=A0ABU8U552_9ACTN
MDGRPSTLAVFTQWTEERYGPETALRFRSPDGGWQTRTYGELGAEARAVGRALLGLGVAAGERVAVVAETRPQWTYTHFGVLAAGAVLVPVYPTAGRRSSPGSCRTRRRWSRSATTRGRRRGSRRCGPDCPRCVRWC